MVIEPVIAETPTEAIVQVLENNELDITVMEVKVLASESVNEFVNVYAVSIKSKAQLESDGFK